MKVYTCNFTASSSDSKFLQPVSWGYVPLSGFCIFLGILGGHALSEGRRSCTMCAGLSCLMKMTKMAIKIQELQILPPYQGVAYMAAPILGKVDQLDLIWATDIDTRVGWPIVTCSCQSWHPGLCLVLSPGMSQHAPTIWPGNGQIWKLPAFKWQGQVTRLAIQYLVPFMLSIQHFKTLLSIHFFQSFPIRNHKMGIHLDLYLYLYPRWYQEFENKQHQQFKV